MDEVVQLSRWRAFWERGGFWRALLLVVVYLALYLLAGRLTGVVAGEGFDDPLSSPSSVFVNIVAPILVGIALLAAFGASLGWLRALFARQPIGGSWWMWILPIVILAYNMLRFAATDYSRYSVATVAMVLFAGLCIGLAEEGLTRGFAVTLLRKAGYRELAVAALSSLLFAASHSVNILAGQSPIAVGLTVVYTFLFGVGMYLTLRVTRNLLWPILLHASTDPSGILLAGGIDSVGGGAAQASTLVTVAGTANYAVMLLGVIFIWFIRGRVVADDPVDVVDSHPAQTSNWPRERQE